MSGQNKLYCTESTLKHWGNLDIREKYYEIFIVVVLLVFGSYHSILYFGHQAVPNPDFVGYLQVADELLSFRLPSDYRTLPVLGLLQRGVSYLVGGPQAELTAGWLINAILHPLNIVLIWLVGKRIIGRPALWVAIIVAINPDVLRQVTDPITETTFLFFILLTFYFIFRQSRLSYLLASVTTMIRYEGVALLLAVFIMDVINHHDKGERIKAFVYAALAMVPFSLWIGGTAISLDSQPSHYFNHYYRVGGEGVIERVFSGDYIRLMYKMGFQPLYSILHSIGIGQFISILGRVLILVIVTFGTVYGLWKRQWNILALLIFLVPYVLAHSSHALRSRHCIATHWMILMITIYGLQNGWKLIIKSVKVPQVVITLLQSLVLVLAFAYLIVLIPYASKIPGFMSVPYVTGIIIAAILLVRSFLYKARYLWPDFVLLLILCCMVVSNQFVLNEIMGDGQGDIEFKLLGEWYLENAEPGEKIVTTLAATASLFAPGHKDSFIYYKDINADSPADFIRQCKTMDIVYVAWDSRIGLQTGAAYYNKWRLKNMAMLETAKNVEPFQFVDQIRVSEKRFINIFRLQKNAPI